MSTTEEVWIFIDEWLTAWMATHPEDDRSVLGILLSPDFQDLKEEHA